MAVNPARSKQNQTNFWNQKVAAATTPEQVVAVWYDACRTVAKKAKRLGRPEVETELANVLHDFFRRHTR
jgi:hypothetical protein